MYKMVKLNAYSNTETTNSSNWDQRAQIYTNHKKLSNIKAHIMHISGKGWNWKLREILSRISRMSCRERNYRKIQGSKNFDISDDRLISKMFSQCEFGDGNHMFSLSSKFVLWRTVGKCCPNFASIVQWFSQKKQILCESSMGLGPPTFIEGDKIIPCHNSM